MLFKRVFLYLSLGILYLPLTRYLGISEKTGMYGVEPIIPLPSLVSDSFWNGTFQKHFEGYWKTHFGFRRTMLKTKNQLYDWVNFGKVHCGAGGSVIQGNKGYLFGELYFISLRKPCRSVPPDINRLIRLSRLFKERGIEFYVILAPNKAVTYADLIPSRFKFFLGQLCSSYERIESMLQNAGVSIYNAQALANMMRYNEHFQPFSLTGTHWNHYAAGRTLEEFARVYNWTGINVLGMYSNSQPYTTEMDLANLLNLWRKYSPKQQFYKYHFGRTNTTLSGVTTIIGNSFSNEFTRALADAGIAATIRHFENKPLTNENVSTILTSKRILWIYTDVAIMTPKHQMYKKVDKLLSTISR